MVARPKRDGSVAESAPVIPIRPVSAPLQAVPTPKPAKTSVALPSLGKPAGKKADRIEVPGNEQLVEEAWQLKQELDSAESLYKAKRDEIVVQATAFRTGEEECGRFLRNLYMLGQSQPCRVTFKEQFKSIKPEVADWLRANLGERGSELFVLGSRVTLREGMLERLRQKLGAEFSMFVSEEPEIRPVEDFMERRFALRPSLTAEQNATLDAVTQDRQYSPTVTWK